MYKKVVVRSGYKTLYRTVYYGIYTASLISVEVVVNPRRTMLLHPAPVVCVW